MSRHLTENLKGTVREAASMAPLAPSEEVNTLAPRRLVASLFRQSRLILGLTTLGVLITGFIALSTPNTYRSRGTFLYTTGSESVQVDPMLGGGAEGEAILGNATYVFQADGLLERVIEQPGMMQKLLRPTTTVDNAFLKITQWQTPEDIDFESEEARDAAIKVLRSSLELSKPRNTDVLEVAYTAGDPKLAQEILNVYMQQAREWHLSVYNDEARLELVESKAKQVDGDLAAAKQAHESFLRELQLHDFQIALATAVENAREEQRRLRDVEGNIARLESHIEQLSESLETIKPVIETEMAVPQPDPLKVRLEDDIAVREAKLVVLNTRILEPLARKNNAEYKSTVDEIAALKERLDEHLKTVKNVGTVQRVEVVNPEHTETNTALMKARLDLRGHRSELPFVTSASEESTARLVLLERKQAEYRDLEQAVARLSAEKERTDMQLSQALRKRELAKGAFSSLQQIDEASKPLEKDGPNRTKLVLMGFFGGLFAALGLVLLRTMGDTTVRSREDLDRLAGVAVLGTFPRLDGRNLRRHRNLREQST